MYELSCDGLALGLTGLHHLQDDAVVLFPSFDELRVSNVGSSVAPPSVWIPFHQGNAPACA